MIIYACKNVCAYIGYTEWPIYSLFYCLPVPLYFASIPIKSEGDPLGDRNVRYTEVSHLHSEPSN